MTSLSSPIEHSCFVYVVDDDAGVLGGLASFIESMSYTPICYSSAANFLDDLPSLQQGCLVIDVQMPYMSGIELQRKLMEKKFSMPIIFISGHSDIPTAVDRIKSGAIDFLTKPINNQRLLESLNSAFRMLNNHDDHAVNGESLTDTLAQLTRREIEVFHLLLEGSSSKLIAKKLSISTHTVDVHRSRIFKKMRVTSIAQLILQAGKAGYQKPER